MRTVKQIRRFIENALLLEPSKGRDPLADNLLDSLDVEELLAHLEKEYGIEFATDELVPENFASLRVLADLVEAKRQRR